MKPSRAAIRRAQVRFLHDLRAASPGRSEKWYKATMESQLFFLNPKRFPELFRTLARRR